MLISPTNAVKMYKVSKPTLYADMKKGKVSFTQDNRDRRKLNVAELDRLYEKRGGGSSLLTSTNVNKPTDLTEANVNSQQLKQEILAIRQQIENAKDREIELLEQQIEQFKNQIENLNRHLDETREEHRMSLRLLEDKREEQGEKVTDWEEKFQAMPGSVKCCPEAEWDFDCQGGEKKKTG